VLNGIGHSFCPPSHPHVMLLSAADEAGVQRLAATYERYLQRMPQLDPAAESRYLSNLAYTLSSRRSILPWKGFAVAQSLSELKTQWTSTLSKPVRSGTPPAISYVFTGQGAQWPGMTQGLDTYPIFAESLHQSQEFLKKCGCDWILIGE
jgi:acyl transferase domain-containing protein